MSLEGLMHKRIELNSGFNLKFHCDHFEIVKNALWCVEHMYSTDGAKQRIIDSDVID